MGGWGRFSINEMRAHATGPRTFVVAPRVRVRPQHELLVHPREQADGGVRERVPERLRLRRLLGDVPAAGLEVPLAARQAFLLRGRVGEHEVREQEERGARWVREEAAGGDMGVWMSMLGFTREM